MALPPTFFQRAMEGQRHADAALARLREAGSESVHSAAPADDPESRLPLPSSAAWLRSSVVRGSGSECTPRRNTQPFCLPHTG